MMEENTPADPSLPTILGGIDPGELLARGMQSAKMSGSGAHGWESPETAEAARLFPGYEVLRLLGRGGMGAVYQARQIELDRLVAIKLLPLEISVDKDFADRFRREARAMAKLNHPHIITVFDFGQTSDGHLFFAMEFVEGANLHDVIHGPGLAPDQALSIAAQVCTALAYAHGKGVVHRDIKPANVMIGTDGQVKVADFGLARLTDTSATDFGHTMTGTVMGTPDYMAPEQKRGMNVDHRADIYSLGVMLYEMLCRETPQGAFELPSHRTGCDPRLDAIVLKAMQQTPDRRYQSTQEMKADVESARSPLPAASLPPTAAPHPLPKALPRTPSMAAAPGSAKKSRTSLVVASTVVFAVLLGAAVFFLKNYGRDASPGTGKVTGGASTTPVANPAPAEPWQDVLRDRVRFPTRNGAPLVPEAGGFIIDGEIPLSSLTAHDGAMRCRFIPRNLIAVYFRRGAGDGYYEIWFWPDGTKAHFIHHQNREDKNGQNVRIWTLPRPLRDGEPAEAELRCVAGTFTFTMNGALLGSEKVNDLPPGEFWFSSNGEALLQSVEYLDLDTARSASPPVGASTSVTATKDAPFVNSLGMKFVPVPITGGPTGGQRVLFSVWETRVQDYEVFAKETKREWPNPGFEQGPTHPAVNVSWEDATAFCAWLTERERKAGKLGANEAYRLPSDHEWSCAVGIGEREEAAKLPNEKDGKIADVFPWGSVWPPPKGAGNYAGEELRPALAAGKYFWIKGVLAGYRDDFVETAPVGSFAANRFGLFDMGGNVWQWCEDWFDKEQKDRGLRGASWDNYDRDGLLSSHRTHNAPGHRGYVDSFRCVVGVSAR